MLVTGEKYKYIFSIGDVRIKPQVYRGLYGRNFPQRLNWSIICYDNNNVKLLSLEIIKLLYKLLFISKICFNEQQLEPCWYGSCHVPVYYKWSSGFSSKNWALKTIHESINMSWRQVDSMVELVSGNACPLEFSKSNIKYAVFLE